MRIDPIIGEVYTLIDVHFNKAVGIKPALHTAITKGIGRYHFSRTNEYISVLAGDYYDFKLNVELSRLTMDWPNTDFFRDLANRSTGNLETLTSNNES